MTEIASLSVMIGADTNNLLRGLRDAEGQVEGFAGKVANKISSVGTSFIKAGAGIQQLTAPLANFGAQGIQVAAEFDSAMAEISARTGTVGADLDSVRQFALQMGADTSFSSQQAADAMLQLLSSGQSTKDAMATLPAVLNAAAASGEDLGRTADILTDIMAQYGLSVSDAGYVTDVLAQAAGASSADMASLSAGFNNVGTVASGFGMSVEDTAAALALLSENGIKGAEAGTALKSMLTNLTSGTDEVNGTLRQLGVSLTDSAGNFRPLNDIIEDLNKAMNTTKTVQVKVNNLTGDQKAQMDAAQKAYAKATQDLMLYQSGLKGTTMSQDEMARKITDLTNIQNNATGIITNLTGSQADAEYVTKTLTRTQEQNFMAIKSLAGAYGQSALSVLIANDGYDEMIALMNGQASAADVAAARMNTFAGRLDSLKGSVETLQINALTPFMNEVLKPLAGYAIEVVNALNLWAIENPGLTSTIVALTTAAVAAGPLLVGIGTAMTLAAPAVTAVAGAFALLVSPLGLAAVGAGALFAALGGIDGIKSKLEGFSSFVSDTLLPAIETGDFSEIGTTIKTKIEDAAKSIGDISLADVADAVFVGLKQAFLNTDDETIRDTLKPMFMALGRADVSEETLGEFATRVKDSIINAISSKLSGVGIDLSAVEEAIKGSFGGLDFTSIQSTFEGHFDTIAGLIGTAASIIFGGPVGLAIGVGKLAVSAIENDFLGIGTLLRESGIATSVETAFNELKTTIGGIIDSIFGGGAQTELPSDSILGFSPQDAQQETTGPLALFVSDVKAGIDALKGVFDNIGNNIGPGLKDLGDGIKGFVDNLSGTETEGLLRVATVIAGAIGAIAAKALEVGSDVLGNALSTIGSALPALGTAINSFISSISQMGEGDWGAAALSVANGVTSLVNAGLKLVGIDLQLPDFTTAINGFKTALDAVPLIINGLQIKVDVALNDFAVSVRAGIREIEQMLLEKAGTLAAAGQLVGIDIGATGLGEQLAGSLEAENLETKISDYLAGNPVTFDASAINWQLTGAPQTFTDSFVNSFVDPVAIQDALTKALEEGDTTTFNALVPLATELGINTDDLQKQYQTGLDTAAANEIYDATLVVDLLAKAGKVDITGLRVALSNAVAGMGTEWKDPGSGGGTTGGTPVPAFASGGTVGRTGLAYVHSGEVITPASKAAPYSGGGNVYNIYSYGTNPAELLRIVQTEAERTG